VVGKALNYMNYTKILKIVIDKGEGEGGRTMEEIYKGSIANFASICLGTFYSLYIK
jgi:hypothetical protein